VHDTDHPNHERTRNFFGPKGEGIDLKCWCDLYSAYYFLDGPTHGRRIGARNQTSSHVESAAIRILQQLNVLSHADLKFIFGWKLGQIDHGASEREQRVIYKPAWEQHLVARMQFAEPDFSNVICELARSMPELQRRSPEAIFDLHKELDNIGPVYALTLLFFLSHGQWPIYDKYAATGLAAITQGRTPGREVKIPELSSWKRYMAYVESVCWVFGRKNIAREQDQAL